MVENRVNQLKLSSANDRLKALLDENNSIYAAMLSSIDGHPIAQYAKKEFNDSKLAAMTSSCLALSEKIALEAKQNNCNFVIIQNENGYLVLKRVGKKLVISSLANSSINLGMLLTATRSTAEALEGEISQN